MKWEKIPCRHCGMEFENLRDCIEHERCHVSSQLEVKTEPNSHPSDGGPKNIAWAEYGQEGTR